MRDRSTVVAVAAARVGASAGAVRQHWKRILVGAFVGWLFAVIGGAFALASLEFHGLVSRTTSDELGIVLVLYGVGLGRAERVHVQAGPTGESASPR